jgi:hypothetical protein
VGQLRLKDWSDSWRGWLLRIQDKQFRFADLVRYNAGSLSPKGDNLWVPPPRDFPRQDAYPFPTSDLPSVDAFKRFAAAMRAKNVRLLFTWCNFERPETEAAARQPAPKWMTDLLRDYDIPVLDTPADDAFPRAWFTDTEYHVTQPARRLRTEELIRQLRPHLGLPLSPDAVSGVLLVYGQRHRLTPGNIFADDLGVRTRYLVPDDGPTDDPRAITGAGVADLIAHGTPVYINHEDPADALLATAGLSRETKAESRESVQQWFARHPSHLILLAATDDHQVDKTAWQPAIPDSVLAALRTTRPVVAAFGTGPYADVQHIVTATGPTADLESKLPVLMKGHHAMVGVVALHAGPTGARINFDAGDFSTTDQGIAVAAVDAEIGTVVDTAVFKNNATDVLVWRLDRIVAASPPLPSTRGRGPG